MTTRARFPQVFNLSTGEFEATYSCSPKEAVIAAHAQSLGDYNTWDYDKKYGHLVKWGKRVVTCGNFTAGRFGNER